MSAYHKSQPLIFKEFENLHSASQVLARDVTAALITAITARNKAVLAVPGGTTPVHFLKALGQPQPGAPVVDWSKLLLMPTDERCVEPCDTRSNQRMLRENFAPLGLGIAHFQPLYSADEAEMKAIERSVHALPPLDVLVSGMGADGHVASLFPGDAALRETAGADLVQAEPSGLEPRISLSRKRLTSAGFVALLIAGTDKKQVLEEAAKTRDALALPVAVLMQARSPLIVYWADR